MSVGYSSPVHRACLLFVTVDYLRKAFNASLAVLIAYLSFPVMSNLLSHRQAMNTSFDSLRLVNTYGAFGRLFVQMPFVFYMGT